MTVCLNNIKKLLLVGCLLVIVGMSFSTLASCFQNSNKYADIHK